MLWQILRVERTKIHPEKLRACIWPTHSRSRSRLLFFKIPFKLHQFIRGYSLGELCSLRQKLEPFQRCRSSLLRNLHWNEKTQFCRFYSKVNGLIHHNVNLIMSCFWNKNCKCKNFSWICRSKASDWTGLIQRKSLPQYLSTALSERRLDV